MIINPYTRIPPKKIQGVFLLLVHVYCLRLWQASVPRLRSWKDVKGNKQRGRLLGTIFFPLLFWWLFTDRTIGFITIWENLFGTFSMRILASCKSEMDRRSMIDPSGGLSSLKRSVMSKWAAMDGQFPYYMVLANGFNKEIPSKNIKWGKSSPGTLGDIPSNGCLPNVMLVVQGVFLFGAPRCLLQLLFRCILAIVPMLFPVNPC